MATKSVPGTCYEDAWRFLLKEQEGELIHGSVQTIGKRINHAWVETETGYVWEPESGEFMKKDYFNERAEPRVQDRYTTEEAAIMAARTGNLGPWSDEERMQFLKRSGNPGFTAKEAKSIGEKLGIDFKRYDVEQFRQGLDVELEHCNVTNCDPLLTGKIAQAHLNELSDYYTRLAKMEKLPEKQLTNKRALNSSDKAGLGKDVEDLLPMAPEQGPPLPRGLGITWPWRK